MSAARAAKQRPVRETAALSSHSFPVLIPKEKPPITVVGDVGGRIAIIVVRNALKVDGVRSEVVMVSWLI